MSTDQPAGGGFIPDPRRIDTTKLGYDDIKGLTFDGIACKNAYMVFHIGYAVPVDLAAADLPVALSELQTHGAQALTKANLLHFNSKALSTVIQATRTQTFDMKDQGILKQALTELNTVRNLPLANTLMGIPRQAPKTNQ
jgi:hypothetical protein